MTINVVVLFAIKYGQHIIPDKTCLEDKCEFYYQTKTKGAVMSSCRSLAEGHDANTV